MNRCKLACKLHNIRSAVVQRKERERGPLFNDKDLNDAHTITDRLLAECRGRYRPFNNCVRSLAKQLGA